MTGLSLMILLQWCSALLFRSGTKTRI